MLREEPGTERHGHGSLCFDNSTHTVSPHYRQCRASNQYTADIGPGCGRAYVHKYGDAIA